MDDLTPVTPGINEVVAYWIAFGSLTLVIVLKALMVLAMLTSQYKPRLDRALAANNLSLIMWFGSLLFLAPERSVLGSNPAGDLIVLRWFLAIPLLLSVAWVAYEWAHERYGTASLRTLWHIRQLSRPENLEGSLTAAATEVERLADDTRQAATAVRQSATDARQTATDDRQTGVDIRQMATDERHAVERKRQDEGR